MGEIGHQKTNVFSHDSLVKGFQTLFVFGKKNRLFSLSNFPGAAILNNCDLDVTDLRLPGAHAVAD